jgi:serine/threonine protein kinase
MGNMNSAPASDLGRSGLIVGGKFRLDAVIGRGGMGSVWSATHSTLGHRVAVKLVAREFVRSPEALRRFDAEAKAAARLASRHVVQVFDNGTLDDGTPYIAMEMLSGENLAQRVERQGSLPLNDVVDILSQCCKGLARAHAAGIVHRDIKPDNIFLARAPDEDREVVKILDFGVAKITLGEEGSTSQTGTGAVLGTPLYMSPEQARGSRDVDHRTDLWSLAMVAYYALTGLLAIGGETFGAVLLKICVEPLPSLLAGAPLLPLSMDRWFQQACAREPAERFQNAQEFIDSLRAAAGDAVGPPRITPPQVVMQQPTMHSAGAGRSSPGFIESHASVAITAAGLPPRHRGLAIAGAAVVASLGLGAAALFALSPGHHETSAGAGPSARDSAERPATSALPPVALSPLETVAEAGAAAATARAAAPSAPYHPPAVAAAPSAPYHPPAVATARAPSAIVAPVVATTTPTAAPAPTINLGY